MSKLIEIRNRLEAAKGLGAPDYSAGFDAAVEIMMPAIEALEFASVESASRREVSFMAREALDGIGKTKGEG